MWTLAGLTETFYSFSQLRWVLIAEWTSDKAAGNRLHTLMSTSCWTNISGSPILRQNLRVPTPPEH